MQDHEKLIKGLEWILENDRFGFGTNWDHGEPQAEEEQAGKYIWDAIALLKEQHAVEPKETWLEKFGSNRKCSECNRYLFPAGKYCPHCGRPVRWDDD